MLTACDNVSTWVHEVNAALGESSREMEMRATLCCIHGWAHTGCPRNVDRKTTVIEVKTPPTPLHFTSQVTKTATRGHATAVILCATAPAPPASRMNVLALVRCESITTLNSPDCCQALWGVPGCERVLRLLLLLLLQWWQGLLLQHPAVPEAWTQGKSQWLGGVECTRCYRCAQTTVDSPKRP